MDPGDYYIAFTFPPIPSGQSVANLEWVITLPALPAFRVTSGSLCN